MVKPTRLTTPRARVIARDIAKQAGEELTYPSRGLRHRRPRVPRRRVRPLACRGRKPRNSSPAGTWAWP